VPPKVVPLGKAGAGGASGPATGPSGPSEQLRRPGTENSERPRVEPLSAERYRIEFTASAEFHAKLEKAKQLLSHALPSGDLEQLFERALDELINREVARRMGTGKPRKPRALRVGSRHVPLEVARQVWERDGAQCSFVDAEGRRCKERRFLTLEHDQPFALSGQPTVENISLLCSAHNAHTARRAFGEAFIAEKRAPARIEQGAGGAASVTVRQLHQGAISAHEARLSPARSVSSHESAPAKPSERWGRSASSGCFALADSSIRLSDGRPSRWTEQVASRLGPSTAA
jgi:hypothetical protein